MLTKSIHLTKEEPVNLDQTIRNFLKSQKNKTILLDELEKLCNGRVSYSDFAQVVQGLTQEGILTPFKNSKPTIKDPSLYYKYRFHKPLLTQDISQEIQLAQKTYHPLNLSAYYHLSQEQWQKDLPFIQQIHLYLLQNQTLPKYEVLPTELSFQLVGDEKWIDEGRGKIILERLNLWDTLKIQKHPDPLMMAVDTTKTLSKQKTYYHLVVENKGTYYALLEELPSTLFTTLIYGQGWKITANITQLEKQLPTLRGTHEIYYFGDLDYEGIAIWHKLSQIRQIHIAVPFYKILLQQKESLGSKNQRRQESAVKYFLKHFQEEKEIINNLLVKGNYYPQEAILENELREIFKDYKLNHRLEG